MDGYSIKLQLKDCEVTELHKLYQQLLKDYKMINRHSLLMRAHITELAVWLSQQVRMCKRKITIQLEGSSLLAFVQLWEDDGTKPGGVYDNCGMVLTNYQGMVMQKFFNQLSQQMAMYKTRKDGLLN